MRTLTLLAAIALTTLAFAMPTQAATVAQEDGPDPISFGTPCFNGGITLIVYGKEVLRCWKPVPSDAVETKCASDVCDLINAACTAATKPVTKKDCVLVA